MFWLILVAVASPFFISASQLDVSVSAPSAILINADTGAILYAKKPRQVLFPASITKIATALYVLKLSGNRLDPILTADSECIGSVSEEAKIKANYTLPSYWLVTDSSHIGIKKGEQLSIRDLMFGMMVASGDDAANVLAYHYGKGDINAFMDGLNKYLKELGCKDTNFNNPHGLHHPKHVTSAYDMALITKAAIKNPNFNEFTNVPRWVRPKTNKQESTVLVQTNRLLRKGEYHYSKAFGVKTGVHSKAQNTFVAAAKDGDRTLIAVLMKVKDRKNMFADAIRLFEAAFNQPKVEKVLLKAGPQKYAQQIDGASLPLTTYVKEDVTVAYYPAEEEKIRAFLQWDTLSLPIKQGDPVGKLVLKNEQDREVKTAILYAEEDVSTTLLQRLKNIFTGGYNGLFWTAAAVFVIYFFRRR